MSPRPAVADPLPAAEVAAVLPEIAAGAEELDRNPRFPDAAFAALSAAETTTATLPGRNGERPPIADEWAILRAVAAADASVGRILDGHLNGVDRIVAAAAPDVRDEVLSRVRDGALLGVWGADPGPDEGEPARVAGDRGSPVLEGTKTFCSGAGGVELALVMVRGPEGGPPWLVLVDLDPSAEIDRRWYRGAGLRASESHRVTFNSTPVRAVIGAPGELGRDPWFSRDAMRTAATWAGMADAAADASRAELAARRRDDPLAQLAAGRIAAAAATIDVWLGAAAPRAESGDADLRALSIELRAEVAGSSARILDEAARACGSHVFATGGALDRARRDLELFTLQHRLDPLLQRLGRDLLDPRAGGMSDLLEDRFDRIYAAAEDPWSYETSRYEAGKYAATLALAAPGPIGRGLEIGCSIGVFTGMLADRCADLVAVDLSAAAVKRARRRHAVVPGLRIERRDARESIPEGPFDLVVCSEVLYYWSAGEVERALTAIEAAMRPGAALVAANWRGLDAEAPLDARRVEAIIDDRERLSRTDRRDAEGYLLGRWEAR